MSGEAPTAGQVASLVVICFLLAPRLLRLIGTLIGDIARSSIRGRVPPVHRNRVGTAYDFSAIPLGSTVLYRTYALEQVLDEYETEHCYFGKIGALTADEHSFYNLYLLQHDDRFNVPFTPGTSIEVCIYCFSDFITDCERHIRSTWRISTNMLTSEQCLRYPWGLYGTWLSELASFTLIWDAIIISLFFCLFGMKLVEAVVTMIHMDFRYCDFLGILPLLIFLIPCHYIYTILKIKALLTYQHIEHAEYEKLDRERDKLNEPTWLIGGDSVLQGPPKRQYKGLKNASFMKKKKALRPV
ncbi:hypothetical protein Neosp_011654 [[Neocosmospora] mangrovei]